MAAVTRFATYHNAGEGHAPFLAQPRLRRGTVGKDACADDGSKVTINEMLDEVGFGPYQVHVLAMCAGALMGEAGCVVMVNSLVTAVSDEFELKSTMSRALFGFCLFFGFQIGAAVAGPLSDSRGRRIPVLAGYIGMLSLCGLAFCITNAVALHAVLVLQGAFAGLCVPAVIVILTEVFPTHIRGLVVAGAALAFRLGHVWSALGLYLLMPSMKTGPWRWLILWSLAPALPSFVVGLCSRAARHDSPHFLAIQRRQRELVSSLNIIAEMNNRPDRRIVQDARLHGERAEEEPSTEALAKVLCVYPYWAYFCIIVIMLFLKEMVSGGLPALWPRVFSHLDDPAYRADPALALVLTGLAGIPGCLLAMWMIKRFPRRASLVLGATACGGGALMMMRLDESHWVGMVGLVLMQLACPVWFVVLLVYPSEIFPAEVRARAFSATFFLGLCGAEAVHVTSSFFSNDLCLVLYGCAAFASALFVFALPETKDSELFDYLSNDLLADLLPAGPSDSGGEEGGPDKGYGSVASAEKPPVAEKPPRQSSV